MWYLKIKAEKKNVGCKKNNSQYFYLLNKHIAKESSKEFWLGYKLAYYSTVKKSLTFHAMLQITPLMCLLTSINKPGVFFLCMPIYHGNEFRPNSTLCSKESPKILAQLFIIMMKTY